MYIKTRDKKINLLLQLLIFTTHSNCAWKKMSTFTIFTNLNPNQAGGGRLAPPPLWIFVLALKFLEMLWLLKNSNLRIFCIFSQAKGRVQSGKKSGLCKKNQKQPITFCDQSYRSKNYNFEKSLENVCDDICFSQKEEFFLRDQHKLYLPLLMKDLFRQIFTY